MGNCCSCQDPAPVRPRRKIRMRRSTRVVVRRDFQQVMLLGERGLAGGVKRKEGSLAPMSRGVKALPEGRKPVRAPSHRPTLV